MKKHIQKHLENLKEKPVEHRKKMATIFAIATTVGIIILWLVILSIFKQPAKESNIYNAESLQSTFGEISDSFSNVNDSFNEQKENFEDIENQLKEQQDAEINFEVKGNVDIYNGVNTSFDETMIDPLLEIETTETDPIISETNSIN